MTGENKQFVPEGADGPERAQFLNVSTVEAAVKAAAAVKGGTSDADIVAGKRISFTPVVDARPRETVILNPDLVKSVTQGARHNNVVREMAVVKPKVEGPISADQRNREEILKNLAIDTDSSIKKIADVLLFNLRGLRTSQQLPARDFRSGQELEEIIKSLPALKDSGDVTMVGSFGKNGGENFEPVRESKIITVPLSDLTIAGSPVDVKLELRFIPRVNNSGNFQVVDVKILSRNQSDVTSEKEVPPAQATIIQKFRNLFGKTK